MGDTKSSDEQLRQGSIRLCQLHIQNCLTRKEYTSKEWRLAINATIGACLTIEDSFVDNRGWCRERAQDEASRQLGAKKVEKILKAMKQIFSPSFTEKVLEDDGLDGPTRTRRRHKAHHAMLSADGRDC